MSFELRRERVGGDMERLARERFRNGVEGTDVEADVTIVSLCLFVFIYI